MLTGSGRRTDLADAMATKWCPWPSAGPTATCLSRTADTTQWEEPSFLLKLIAKSGLGLIMGKHHTEPNRGTKCLTTTFRSGRRHSVRERRRLRGDDDYSNVQSGLDPENERTSAENQRNPHAVALVKSIVPMLLFQSGTRTGFIWNV